MMTTEEYDTLKKCKKKDKQKAQILTEDNVYVVSHRLREHLRKRRNPPDVRLKDSSDDGVYSKLKFSDNSKSSNSFDGKSTHNSRFRHLSHKSKEHLHNLSKCRDATNRLNHADKKMNTRIQLNGKYTEKHSNSKVHLDERSSVDTTTKEMKSRKNLRLPQPGVLCRNTNTIQSVPQVEKVLPQVRKAPPRKYLPPAPADIYATVNKHRHKTEKKENNKDVLETSARGNTNYMVGDLKKIGLQTHANRLADLIKKRFELEEIFVKTCKEDCISIVEGDYDDACSKIHTAIGGLKVLGVPKKYISYDEYDPYILNKHKELHKYYEKRQIAAHADHLQKQAAEMMLDVNTVERMVILNAGVHPIK